MPAKVKRAKRAKTKSMKKPARKVAVKQAKRSAGTKTAKKAAKTTAGKIAKKVAAKKSAARKAGKNSKGGVSAVKAANIPFGKQASKAPDARTAWRISPEISRSVLMLPVSRAFDPRRRSVEKSTPMPPPFCMVTAASSRARKIPGMES